MRARSESIPATLKSAFVCAALLALWIPAAAAQEESRSSAQGQREVEAIELGVARARLLLEVERDPAAALAALDELAARAAAPAGFERQAKALAAVAAARAEVLLALGRLEEARAAVGAVLPAAARAEPDSKLALAAEAALADPRLVRLRAEESAARVPEGEAQDTLAETVRELVFRQNKDGLRSLGSPALRELERQVAAGRDEVPSHVARDPLTHLIALAPLQTGHFLLEQVEGGGEIFHRRVLSALAGARVLTSPGTWDCTVGRPPVLLEPVWRELLGRLVQHPGALRPALPLIRELARRDALTPLLTEAVARALQSSDPDVAKEAFLAIADLPGVAGVKPIYESLLDHPEPSWRLAAARMLASYEHLGRLLDAVEAPDPALREELAKALLRQRVAQISYLSDCTIGTRTVSLHDPRPEEIPVLAALCMDPLEAVRVLAVQAAVTHKVELPEEVLLSLTRDLPPQTLAQVARLPVSDARVLGALLEGLATSPDPGAAWPSAVRLAAAPWQTEHEALLPALEALLFRSPLTGESRWKALEVALRAAWTNPAVTKVVVEWTLEREDGELLGLILRGLQGEEIATKTLAPGQLLELAERALRTPQEPALLDAHANFIAGQITHLVRAPSADPALLMALSRFGELPLHARIAAVEGALLASSGDPSPDEEKRAAILDVLGDARWGDVLDIRRRGREWSGISLIREAAGGDLWNRVAAAALNAEIEERLLELVVVLYDPLASGGAELARAILTRWPVDGERAIPAVERTLWQAAELGLEPELLVRGLERYPTPVVAAMGRARDPIFLEPLARALEADWLPPAERGDVQHEAAAALAGLLSDEAARVLLSCAERTGDTSLRELCFESLETIRTYQDARERWERRVAEREARERAVERLLAMLAAPDPTTRATALMALGELGEARALPRITELLADPEPAVREAALGALRRLRRQPEPAPPEGAREEARPPRERQDG